MLIIRWVPACVQNDVMAMETDVSDDATKIAVRKLCTQSYFLDRRDIEIPLQL